MSALHKTYINHHINIQLKYSVTLSFLGFLEMLLISFNLIQSSHLDSRKHKYLFRSMNRMSGKVSFAFTVSNMIQGCYLISSNSVNITKSS